MTATLASGGNDLSARASASLAGSGMFTWSLGADRQGLGLSPIEVVGRLVELGEQGHDPSSLFAASAQLWAVQYPIERFGVTPRHDRFVAGLAGGTLVGAHAITEPDAGSDVAAMRTSARPVDGGYVLDGRKSFVTNAPEADVFLVIARTASSPLMGLTAFLVERETPGLSTTPALRVSGGLATAPLGDVVFDSCHVPASGVLGQVGQGLRVFLTAMQAERLFILAPALGVARREVRRAIATSPRPPSNTMLQALAAVLVAELTVKRSAASFRFGASVEWRSSVAKLAAARAIEVAASALASLDGTADRLCEAQAAAIYSGTSNVQLEVLARALSLTDGGRSG